MLDQLATIMESEPNIQIRVTSHTDSRGTGQYNQWLSEQRAKRTVEYILSKGIAEDRITQEAFGETKLLNECSDGVYCTEEKHALNRRSEFVIVKY